MGRTSQNIVCCHGQGRIRELEEIRAELAEKELVLLGKEQELLERDQTVAVLREEVTAISSTVTSILLEDTDGGLCKRCISSALLSA